MERTLLQARIIDNNLLKNAGKYFIDESSDCIKQLNLEGKSAFIGILNKKGVYTNYKGRVYLLSNSLREIWGNLT